MSIVFITSKNNPKDDFVKSLNLATKGGVSLMVVVKKKKNNFLKRIKNIYKRNKKQNLFKQIFYWILLKLNKKVSNKLVYFKLRDTKSVANQWSPKVIEVDDVNGQNLVEILQEISPKLIVIWNTPIIKKHILDTAKNVINLHMGVCPVYRGAAANQFAVYKKDFSNIGATIHYVDETLDGGDIIEIIKANTELPPKKLFKKLNNDSEKAFLKIVVDIYQDRLNKSQKPQSILNGNNFALKYWTPEVRYKTAKILSRWEKEQINS